MDRMLHRGKWADPEEAAAERAPKPPAWERLLGIDARYTRGDKALAWSVFLYSFVLWFCVCFLGNVVWHAVSPQPPSWWGRYFFWTNLVVPCLVGAVSTVWFGVFSSRDLLRLFRDLEARDRSGAGPDVADDGRVETS